MDKKIVLFNGPPGSGKDTAAMIAENDFWCCEIMEFKQKLFSIALEISGMDYHVWFSIYNNRKDKGRANKETPLPELGGLSQRQFLIKISEEWVKPVFGERYFGEAAAKAVAESSNILFFFSDSGFMEEVYPLFDLVGKYDVLLVKLYREGCSYEGDSRNYLPEEEFINVAHITNEDIEDFQRDVLEVVSAFSVE